MIQPEFNKIYTGDCLEIMRQWPDKCVDLVITDPPYGLKICDSGRMGGSGIIQSTKYEPVKWDDEPMSEIQFKEIQRISENQIIFGYNYFSLPPSHGIIVWDKKLVNNWNDSFSDCEIAWTSFDRPARMFRHLWMGALRASENFTGDRIHPTQKPIELLGWILSNYSDVGSTILDPFCGSGSTLCGCERLERNWIGIEINPTYVHIAEERIARERAQLKLPL